MLDSRKRRIVKNSYFGNKFIASEMKRLVFRYNMSLHFLDFKYKNFFFFKYLRAFHLNSSLCRLHGVCFFSGRAH